MVACIQHNLCVFVTDYRFPNSSWHSRLSPRSSDTSTDFGCNCRTCVRHGVSHRWHSPNRRWVVRPYGQKGVHVSCRLLTAHAEWCVGSGCNCETPGVEDDAQMNAVAKLNLKLAAAAAQVRSNIGSATLLERDVSESLPPTIARSLVPCPTGACCGTLWETASSFCSMPRTDTTTSSRLPHALMAGAAL